MKLFIKILTLVILFNAIALITPSNVSAQETAVSFQVFYDQLSPYGSWVDYQNYGYVWIPDVDREFSPYGTDGHWIFTENGWTWVSDYSWGWAPFHYGRWEYDDSYGWFWVPHNEWGPAWVTWRRSEGYYGWAPMGPGISIELSFGGGYRVPNDRWIFVRDRDIGRPDIDRHYVDRSTNVTIINNSTVINNTYVDNSRHTKYVSGPARDDVQKVTGAAIRPVAIRENDKPGQVLNNNQLRIYRPRMQANNSNDHKPMPSKITALREMKPVAERKQGNQPRNENLPANDKKRSSQQQSGSPSGYKPAGEQPQVVNPSDKKKRDEQPVRIQTARSSDNKGRGQQPLVIKPPGKNKNTDQQSKARNSRAPNKKRQSPQMNPPSDDKGKVREPQSPKPDKQKHNGDSFSL